MTSITEIDNMEHTHTNQELILGLTLTAEIIQFNMNLEQVTGYQRDEVLHKKFDEVLLPIDSIPLWNNLLESIQKNMWIDEFILPLRTKQNQPFIISWTGFFIKDEHGSFKDICLIGKPVVQEVIKTEPKVVLSTKPSEPIPVEKSVEPSIAAEKNTPRKQFILEEPEDQFSTSEPPSIRLPARDEPMKHGRKRILFADGKKAEIESIDNTVQEQTVEPKKRKNDEDRKKFVTSGPMEKRKAKSSNNYNAVLKHLEELETKELQKKKHGMHLRPHRQTSMDESQQHIGERTDRDRRDIQSDEQEIKNEHFSFFSDPFGYRRQREELQQREQLLNVRSQQLDVLQSRLLKEQHMFNIRVEEFSKWREKLEQLEAAIETRRQELMKQEDMLLQNSVPIVTQQVTQAKQDTSENTKLNVPKDDETLDKIPNSAAIIQRGILKRINTLFLELLGYSTEEIIDKSFFDFIALEGLADVEKYYLDRLKGDNVSVYKTIFMAKDNHKISAEVSIKQTIYNGEKAEIAIITCLDSKNI